MEAEMDRLNGQIEQSRGTGFDTKKLNKELEFQNQETARQIEEALQDLQEKDSEISSLRKVLDNYQDQNLDYKEDNKVLNNDVQIHLSVIRDLENIRNELKEELKNYMEEDGRVAGMLTRQNRVETLLSTSNLKLHEMKTAINILN